MNIVTSIHGKSKDELRDNLVSRLLTDISLSLELNKQPDCVITRTAKPMIIVTTDEMLEATNDDNMKIESLFSSNNRDDLRDLKIELQKIGIRKLSDVIDILVLDYTEDSSFVLVYSMLSAMKLNKGEFTGDRSFYIDVSTLIQNEVLMNTLIKIADCYDNLDIVYTRLVK